MRPTWLLALGLLWLGTAAPIVALPARVPSKNHGIPSTIHWISTWNEGWKAARQTHRPILLMFCTAWSPWCQQMDRSVWTQPQLRLLASRYVMIRLDAEKEVLMANRFKVVGYPTILLSFAGHALGQDVGLTPVHELAELMRKGLQLSAVLSQQLK